MFNLDNLVGIFAPNVCLGCGDEGRVLCKRCQRSAGEPPAPRCAGCKALSKNYKTCSACKHWLGIYAVYVSNEYEGIYERLIHAFKFDMKRSTAKPIAKLMVSVLPALASDIVICPLPTASSRIRQRGFDHIKLLTSQYIKHLPDENPWSSWKVSHLLGRRSNVRQLGASRSKRIAQMEEEFYAKDPRGVEGKTILLLDDVMTTGASMSAAAKTLKKAGAKRVYAVVYTQKV